MRVRPHIQAMAALELGRTEMIEEHKGADCPARGMRQRAADGESLPQIDAARNDDDIERVAGVTIARDRVLGGKKAHGAPLCVDATRLVRFLYVGNAWA